MKARDNPFAVDRVLGVRYRPQGWTWEQLLSRLARMDHRGAVVGPEGSGKTTLLEDLADRLAERHFTIRWLRLNRDDTGLSRQALRATAPPVTRRDLVFIDGADLLTRPAWWLIRHRTRQAGGLIVAAHQPGRLPTLVETSTRIELFQAIVRELLDDDLPTRSTDLPALFHAHHGNIREALRAMYDRWAQA